MNHDYIALKVHETRVADLQAEARQDRVVREVLRARRVLARLTAPKTVLPLPLPLPRSEHGASETGTRNDREAA